jgi:hypothetical protein
MIGRRCAPDSSCSTGNPNTLYFGRISLPTEIQPAGLSPWRPRNGLMVGVASPVRADLIRGNVVRSFLICSGNLTREIHHVSKTQNQSELVGKQRQCQQSQARVIVDGRKRIVAAYHCGLKKGPAIKIAEISPEMFEKLRRRLNENGRLPESAQEMNQILDELGL